MPKIKILIVEDEFVVANDLKIILMNNQYSISGIAASAEQARIIIASKSPDWVLLDISLKGQETGIDLAWELLDKKIPFLYISANTNQSTLEAVKKTRPYGFLVKPFRERDLLMMLDIAQYRFNLEHKPSPPEKKLIEGTFIHFKDIIGQSSAFKKVLEDIAIVGPSETSVLILGESGTGKEKIAHSIHDLSPRSEKPLVAINCAALPASLIESELFGYEKGAFTGANGKRIGKFEQADKGTVFLDEVGELPLEAQVKLLRVLQEKEIERLGGDRTIKIDVRIIAATNRNLEKEVAEGRFRLDLYYRLNVFPIWLPPLRERKDDIKVLANYFLKLQALKARKNIDGFSEEVLLQLEQYGWPGNIRELEHIVERSVLLASTKLIEEIDLPAFSPQTFNKNEGAVKTLDEVEKEHIINVLRICKGRVSGVGGAAELLNISPASLYAKIKKLGIKQEYN